MSEMSKRPKAALLAEVLRDPSRWPEGFRWYYPHCDSCAVGLAIVLGMVAEDSSYEKDAAELGIAYDEWLHITTLLDGPDGRGSRSVTPEQVADAIEEALR